jgi:gas vesicle protein
MQGLFGITNLLYGALPLNIVSSALSPEQVQKIQQGVQDKIINAIIELESKIIEARFKVALLTNKFLLFSAALNGAIATILNTVGIVADDARQAGESLYFAIKTSVTSIFDSLQSLLSGRVITPLSSARIERALAKALAFRGNELLRQYTGDLMNAAGLSAQDAGKISAMFYRMSGFNERFIKDLENAARGVQEKFGIPMRDVILQLAENANVAAQYIGRSAREMANAGLVAQRTAISLSKANDISNNLVSDFEKTLIAQSELQSMFGVGFNLDEALYAAQFGTPDQVAEILSSQIRGLGIQNINQLPRSIRNALTRTFGFDDAQLQNILQGKPPEMAMGEAQEKAIDGLQRFTEGLFNAIGGLKTLTAAITTAVTLLFTNLAFKNLLTSGTLQSVLTRFGINAAQTTAAAAGAANIATTAAGAATQAAAGAAATAAGSAAMLSKMFPYLKGLPMSLGKLGLGGLGYLAGSGIKSILGDSPKYAVLGNALGSALQFGSIGATIGSFIPGLGPLAGGLIGAGAGAIYGTLTSPSQQSLQSTVDERAKLQTLRDMARKRSEELLMEQNRILQKMSAQNGNKEVSVSIDKIADAAGRVYG